MAGRPGYTLLPLFLADPGNPGSGLTFGWQMAAILTMTCGTVFLMWLGEQIDEYGIGNGISLLIMAGILSRMPRALFDLLHDMTFELGAARGQTGVETLLF